MSFIEKFYLVFESTVRWTSNLLLVGLFAVIVSAVVVRYFALFEGSLAWAEEFGRFTMIWITMLGSVVAFDRGQHLAIGILPASTPPWVARIVRTIIDLCCGLFLAILAYQSFKLAGKTMRQVSPALGLPFGFVYLSMGVGAVLISIQLLLFVASPKLREARLAKGHSELEL